MGSIVNKLKPLLDENGIEYREHEESLYIPLPNKFGELVVFDLDEGDDIIGLAGEEWHTHSNCLDNEHLSAEEKIAIFIKDIISGKYLLIKEQEPGKHPVRTIEDDLASYKKYLPEGTKYEIYNKT
jgi:hypothetical protein